ALNALSRGPQSNAPASSGGSFSHASGLFTVLVASWIVLLLVTIAGAVVEAASASGSASLAAVTQLPTTTRYGAFVWLRIGLLVLVGALLALRQSRWWRREWAMRWWQAGLIVNVAVLLGTSLSSHAAAMSDPTFPVIVDWLHMLVASLW